jgi:Flp pilus assembly protein TadD
LRLRLRRVSLLALAEKYDKAEAECLALLKETTQPGDVRDIRHQLSGVYSAAKQHDRSEEQLRLILEADPNDDSANNDLGYVLADRGRNLEEAERLIRKAIQLEREQRKTRKVGPDDDRDHAAYIDSLGWVLFRRGRVDEARQELERATALPDGDDPVIWDHLGDVYLKLGQPDRAAAAWHKAAQLYDGDRRRKQDDQYKDLKRKLKLLKANAHR